MTDKLDKLLKFDALAYAEKITGVDSADQSFGPGFSNPAAALGFALLQDVSAQKNQLLKEADDTMLHNDLDRYRRIIETYGFEEVLADKWLSSHDGREETYFIFAHRKGLLLAFDTFQSNYVNGGKVLYNVLLNDKDRLWEFISSGCFHGDVWVGDHDCREALIHNLTKTEAAGQFVTPWVKRPFLWLLHYDDSKIPGYDYVAITEDRIRRLPVWVQEMIGPSDK